MNTENQNGENQSSQSRLVSQREMEERAKVTHNLDTGEDEPLQDLEDKSIMDFGSGSGGGSAGDGGAS